MRRTSAIVVVAVVTVLGASVGFALRQFSDRGMWPDSWPKELEQFRRQSVSFTGPELTAEITHEIHFLNREEFEKAWPHILKLKTEGAPLIIEGVHSTPRFGGWTVAAAVRILCPRTDGVPVSEENKRLLATVPPWPDYVKLPSGGLPEYVVIQNGKWAALERSATRSGTERWFRARVDIVLIADGSIVDLNRIPCPPIPRS